MLHLPPLIVDLGLILGAAAVVTLIFKKLKQPLVLGYIIAGFFVGPHFHLFPTITEADNIRTWADIGVIFLLFGLGLEFSFKKLVKVGGTAAITAIIEVGATISAGFLIGKLLGWAFMDCIFLGGLLGIASTTIIIRAFDELGVKGQKFTGVVMGVLVIEDLVAVVLLVLLSTVAVSRQFEGAQMISSILKLGFFLILWFLSGIFFIPTFLKRTRKLMNDETMLIVSLALCFGMVILATQAGFSSALGAFIMGSILAETMEGKKIEHLLMPVKDLFGAIFFVSVGMLIDPQILVLHTWPIIAGTLLLLLGKPLFVTLGAVLSGQPVKTSIQAGMSLSQIGEFSFIIATLGVTLKETSDFLYPIAVAISVITAFTTPYMIRLSGPLHLLVEKMLPVKWKEGLQRYSAGAQTITSVSDWRKVLRSYALNTLTNAVIILSIIFLALRYLQPVFASNVWGALITVAITLLFLSPFLWALTVRRTEKEAHARVWQQKKFRGPLVMLELLRIGLAVFFIGFLCDRLFSQHIALYVSIAMVALLIVFSRKLQSYYIKIEERFLKNLNEQEQAKKNPAGELAPWDAHISEFDITSNSGLAGKSLEALSLREQFGVNVAMIERGNRLISTPGKDEFVFPGDRLSAIGTDEQLQAFRMFADAALGTDNRRQQKQEVVLKYLAVHPGSPYIGQSIRASGLREHAKGIIVGIGRGSERILNPPGTMQILENDIIWIVGNYKRLMLLTGEARR
ncbi:MAG: sodium/hydrogen exchanger [Ferruginibacter sp.]|nr:sodium/hydrogen exchanger [Ferruginibacter sp.]